MDFRATKDRYERETDEAERLVRPAPKVKPPRHDRRREEMRPDSDPDIEGDIDVAKDPDLSMNYKTIGGSMGQRIVARLLNADLMRSEDLIPVRMKENPSHVVQVKEETLRQNPSKYEPVDEKDEKEKPEQKQQPAEEPEQGKKKAPKEEAQGEKSPEVYAKARQQLEGMAANDPELVSILRDFADPKKEVYDIATRAPHLPAAQFLRGRKPPEGIETVGDLLKAVQAKPAETKPSKKTKPAKPSEKPGEKEDLPSSPEALRKYIADAVSRAVQEALKGKAAPPISAPPPSGKDTEPPQPPTPPPAKPEEEQPEAAPPAEEKKPKEKKPKDKKPKPGVIPDEQRRPVTSEEVSESIEALVDTFPPAVAASLIARNLHPDDVRGLVRDFHTAKSLDVNTKDLESFVADTSKFYATDLDSVKPPTSGKNAAGVEKPFEELSPADQAKTTREHQLRTLALSFAARSQVIEALERESGAPKKLAGHLADFMLSSVKSPDRSGQAKRAAQTLFNETVAEGKSDNIVPDRDVRKILKAIPDLDAQKLAVGFFQAQDYQQAKDKFLGADSKEAISEFHNPNEIVSGIRAATEFLHKQSARYPKDSVGFDTSLAFRTRVLKRLRSLVPDKYPLVTQRLDQVDADDYEVALGKHEQALAKYRKQMKSLIGDYDKDYAKYRKQLDKHDDWIEPEPPEPMEPPSIQERKLQEKVREPKGKDPKAWAKYKRKIQKIEDAYDRDLRKYQQEREGWETKRQERAEEAPIKAPKTISERMQEQGIVEPPEPIKPARYDEARDSPERTAEAKKMLEETLRQMGGGEAPAAKVAARAIVAAKYSSYSGRSVMANQIPDPGRIAGLVRQAVYWGVEPYLAEHEGFAPYPGWQQAHARDISSTDLNNILGSARDWLKTPVLSSAVDGIVRDTQLRAALDLAIRDHDDGKYSVGLHPALYNDLLARLAGVSQNETLLTVTASAAVKPGSKIRADGDSLVVKKVFARAQGAEQGLGTVVIAENSRGNLVVCNFNTHSNQNKWEGSAWFKPDQTDEAERAAKRLAEKVKTAGFGYGSTTMHFLFVQGKRPVPFNRDVTDGINRTFIPAKGDDGEEHDINLRFVEQKGSGYLTGPQEKLGWRTETLVTVSVPEGAEKEATRALEALGRKHGFVVEPSTANYKPQIRKPNKHAAAESIYGVARREMTMKASEEIRSFAARAASSDPELAYDLVALADRVAGELPPEFLEQQQKKKDEAAEKKDEGQGQQQKEASTAALSQLRSLIIRTAHAHPEARGAFLPLLQAIKAG